MDKSIRTFHEYITSQSTPTHINYAIRSDELRQNFPINLIPIKKNPQILIQNPVNLQELSVHRTLCSFHQDRSDYQAKGNFKPCRVLWTFPIENRKGHRTQFVLFKTSAPRPLYPVVLVVQWLPRPLRCICALNARQEFSLSDVRQWLFKGDSGKEVIRGCDHLPLPLSNLAATGSICIANER